jgi:cell division septation protein DedD/nucleoid DNA-binding protein
MASLSYTLNLHLAFLLFQEDSLSVRGLGTFSVRRYGAEIQLPAGLILPPARRVSFSPQAEFTSPSLIKHLQHIECLDEAGVAEAIAACTAEYRRVLDRGDRLVLHGIGSLRRIESQWTFKASLEANFLSSSFGLPMFRMDLATTESIAPSTPSKGDAPRVRSWQAAAIVAGALGLAAIGGTKDNVRSTVQQATIDWNVSAWFSAQKSSLIRTWDSWTESVEEFVTPANEPVANPANGANEPEASKPATSKPAANLAKGTNEPAASKPAANLAKGTNEPAASKPAANLAKGTNEPAASKPAANLAKGTNEPISANLSQPRQRSQPQLKGNYALIVGAFAETANAERLASELKKSGYQAEVLDAKVGLKKVALRTFASEDAARKAKAQLKGDFPAIWIYHE